MNRCLLAAVLLGMGLRANAQSKIVSQLEIYDLKTDKRRIVRTDSVRFEAPNWSRDGKHIIINERGLLYRVDIKDGSRERIETGIANQCNNDHGISPDGKLLVVSHNDPKAGRGANSRIYILPYGGGEPRLITEQAPSYWHGWSPDGKTLVFAGLRTLPDGSRDFDIYAVPVEGGPEKRLTDVKALDDGPDYSPDGKYIYFNSVRSGTMQLWRMRPDGSEPTQLTNDAYNNWFPHPSPDGSWIVFISYIEPIDPNLHPADKQVMLRLMNVKTGKVRELARFRGGQGTINVPSWSPDSRQFGFVTYPEVK